MPIIVADFTGVKTTPQPLPIGSYAAKIAEVKEGTSAAGQPKIDVKYILTHQGFEGRPAFHSISLQKQALFSLKRLLLATGDWDEEQLSGPIELDTADMVGCEVCLVITANSYVKNKGTKEEEVINTTGVSREIDVSEAEGPASSVSAASGSDIEGDAGTLFGTGV